MKKLLIVLSVFFITISAGAVYVISQSKSNEGKLSADNENEPERLCCSGNTGVNDVSDNSVYLLDEEWKTQNNSALRWSSLKGTTRIMAMIFTSCTYACPVIVNDMKKIETALSHDDLKKIKFLLVSIDPERDTPEALKEYARAHKLDLNRWQLLTSNESNIAELAAVMGFKYKKEKNGSFSHSNIISVLNKGGEIAYQHFGLNKDINDVVEEIKKIN